MSGKLTAALVAVLIASLFGLTYYHYRVQSLNRDVAELSKVARQQQATLDQIEVQRQAVAAIDIKHTKELADAKSENERIRADIANGTKRLQLNATCSKPVPKTTGPASVPDDASARLTDSAQRDYISLRERIGIATSQISGLQDYITNVCLAK
ncbi:lysis protein [Yersinia enterocolitica]|uniref:lysis protein n=1 Tax=Yersinia enterocolitica TaxID=630 RepID=UPI0021E8C69A|nr:lysis protein [Yersinia enterocolitica]EKN4766941.1 lysis protein [Yersinia enterocolitica]EKN5953793.1 lysis protein [Yersinia enterocolitica]ELI8291972.1 lysis protein [Yersinia enterocolitica]ELW7404226.1 lysis protein [Yersinia enterocolitica]UYJ99867.1 lysis protein [Yersinia enterocolitica]